MTAHTPHAADLIDLGCPRCLAQWEVIRATQTMPTSASVTAVWAVYADPLTVWPADKEARRMQPATVIIGAVLVSVLVMLAYERWEARR